MVGDELGDWAVWSVVEQSSKEIGIEHFGAHDLHRMRQALPEERGRSGADQIPTRPLLHTDDGTLSRCRTGDRRGRE